MDEEVKVKLETNVKALSTDPYTCTVKAKHSYIIECKTVRHIPREICRYVYFFVKEENIKITQI